MGALDWIGDVTGPTRDIAEEIDDRFDLPHYGDPYNGEVMWGKNDGGGEHGTGRALDIMVDSKPGIGENVAEFLWANRRRYGLIHYIWQQEIRSTRVAPGEERPMADRGSPTENHMDHIHVLFDGRRITGGGGTQDVPYTPPAREKFYEPKGVDLSVRDIQKIVNVTVDGMYGDDTKAAVAELQRRLDVPDDGYWGPVTEEAYEDFIKPKREPGGGIRAPQWPLPPGYYFGPKSGPRQSVSGYYGHRSDLRVWQRRMGLPQDKGGRGWTLTADGLYGPQTKRVTKQFQKQKGLKVDGLIGPATWKAAWEKPIT